MEDRRTKRTRKMLEQALLDLIEEEGYDSITVQQITNQANIGRATFYLHYKDKEDLLLATLQSVLEDIARFLQPLQPYDLLTEDNTLSAKIFQHVAEHRRLYRVLLGEKGAAFARNRLYAYVTKQAKYYVVTPLMQKISSPAVPGDLLASYLCGSLFALITWWLDQQQPPPPEEMGVIMRKFTTPGMLQVLGIDETILQAHEEE